jgi:hypothetical protein
MAQQISDNNLDGLHVPSGLDSLGGFQSHGSSSSKRLKQSAIDAILAPPNRATWLRRRD